MSTAAIVALQAEAIFAQQFRVVRPLSQGGMGAVYVVEQLSTGRQRALKLMHPQLVADAKQRARFEQEARIGALIESEHVVEVVGAGVDPETDTPWLAMELLRGEDLASLVRRAGPLQAEATLEIVEQLGHAVGAAHAAKIVHRDLKPENVFVAEAKRAGARHMVKVLDFGIAKVVAEAKSTGTAAIGSPMWMAPEQTARGGRIAPQTDVWAIGLIVFHLLTGRYFWRAAEDAEATITQLLREIAIDPVPLASDRARELGMDAALPPGFDAWFARSVDRSIDARFADAQAQLQGLQALYAGRRVEGPTTATAPAVVLAVATPVAPTVHDLPPVAVATQRIPPAELVRSSANLPAPSPTHARRAAPWIAGAAGLAGLLGGVAWLFLHDGPSRARGTVTAPSTSATAPTTPKAPTAPSDVPPRPSLAEARLDLREARDALAQAEVRRAESLARRAVDGNPGDAEGWLVLGAALQAEGNGAGAQAAYRGCVAQARTGQVQECRALVR